MNILHLFFEDNRFDDNQAISFSADKGKLMFAVINEENQRDERNFFDDSVKSYLKELLIRNNSNLIFRNGSSRHEILRIIEQGKIDCITYTSPMEIEKKLILNKILLEISNLGIEIFKFDDVPTITPYPLIDDYGEPIIDFEKFIQVFINEIQEPVPAKEIDFIDYEDFSNYFPIPETVIKLDPLKTLYNYLDKKIYSAGVLNVEYHYGTSGLSPYLNSGMLSKRRVIRECFEYGENYPGLYDSKMIFTRRIGLGEFARHLGVLYGSDFSRKHYDHRYYNFDFNNDPELFEKWKNGETGIPVVDASMRFLQNYSYLGHIQRSIAAACLVQIFHIDWRLGDDYFKKILVDYNETISSFNWQTLAGCGPLNSGSPRMVNIDMICKSLDPDCVFIRKNCPELRDKSNGEIHLMNYRNVVNNEKVSVRQGQYLKKISKIIPSAGNR